MLAELESSVSQSKQQFWILGFVNDDKETWARLLAPWAACCGAGGEVGAAKSRDGAEGGIPPGGLCHLPLERRARPVSLGTGVLCHSSTELPLWSLVCPHFVGTSFTHTSVERNYKVHISTIKAYFQEISQRNLCGLSWF